MVNTIFRLLAFVLQKVLIPIVLIFAGIKKQDLEISGATISYLDKGEGETIVMVHGFMANKYLWIPMMVSLARRYRVIAIDLPGHGDSSESAKGCYDIEAQCVNLEEFLRGMGVEGKVHLIGNSMGGAIIMAYAYFFPDRVASLASMCGAGASTDTPAAYFDELASGRLLAADRKSFVRGLSKAASGKEFAVHTILSVMFYDYIGRRSLYLTILEQLKNGKYFELDSIFPAITIPTLILWGRHDTLLDVSMATNMERLLPHSRKVILETSGHIPLVEDVGGSLDAYNEFLGEIG